ncbi:MAG: ABC1 kinase family protein [Myxococcota bacterium]
MTRIIGKYGYTEFVRRSPDLPPEIGVSDFAPPSGDAAAVAPKARRFRMMLEELGPTFIKFGQVLSSRPDLIAPEFVAELAVLQDHCEPLPFDQIKSAIESELQSDPLKSFEWIDPEPLATASIAQVHRATTFQGEEVALKVRRPGIQDVMNGDLDLLYRIARLLDAVIEESQVAEPVGLVREFDRGIREELDFRNEASNILEFRRIHQDRSDIVVPKLYESLSSSGLLTMEFLRGVPFSRLPEGCDRRAIARRVVEEAFQEVFVDGVFHGDPHPGNLLLLEDGRFGVLDLGLLGRLSAPMQENMVVLALGVALRDPDSVARTVVRMGRSTGAAKLVQVRRDVSNLFDKTLGRPIHEIDSQHLVRHLVELALEHGIRLPPEYALLARAGATIEGLVRVLDPELDVAQVARPYAERLLLDRVAPETLQSGLFRALLQIQGLQQEVPLQLSQIIDDMSAGRLGVVVSGPDLDRLSRSMITAGTTVAVAILAGAFIIGSFIGLARLESTLFGVPLVGIIGAVVGTMVLIGLGGYAVVRPRLRKVQLRRILQSRRSRPER